MTTAKNDITGDSIQNKTNSDDFRNNWDRIFGKKSPPLDDDEKEKDNGSKQDNEQTDL